MDEAALSVDALPCAVLCTDGEGRVLQVNATLVTWLGQPAGGWAGHAMDEMLPAASRIFLHTHVWPTILRQGRIDEVHLAWLGGQGDRVPMLCNAVRIQAGGPPAEQRISWALFLARERERFEADLLLARQRLQNMVQSTDAGTWEWNVRTGEVRVDSRWAAILGWTLADLGRVDNSFRAGIAHPDEMARTRQLLREHFAGRSAAYINEVRLRRRDGTWIWVQDRGRVVTRTPDGKPEWMFGIHIDISRIKQQEDDLRRSQELLDRSNQLAGVGGWELDLRSQTLYWSDQTCRIHGVPTGYRPSLEEALAFYPPEARSQVEAAVQAGIAEGTGWDLEVPFVRRDGARLMVHALGRVQQENGEAVRLVGAFQDITARVQQQSLLRELAGELAAQHELLRVTLQSIGDAVITTDVLGRVTWLNPVAERLTGWPLPQAQGRALPEVFRIVHELTREPAPDPVQACLASGGVVGLPEYTLLLARDGQEIGIEDSAAPIRDADGQVHGAVLVFHDVTEQRRLVGEVRHRAAHDVLTGLPNRAEFEAKLGALLERVRADDSRHVLLFLDLDQFKLVNDSCGHAAGDELLRQVAALLRQTVRGSDLLARLGGDEFAVILAHCAGEQALRVASLICERLDEYRFVSGDRQFRIGVSIGLVPVDGRWRDLAAAMQAADAACHIAKERGRNRVHVWQDGDGALQAGEGQAQWAERLERAIAGGHFVLHGQRIVSLAEGDGPCWGAEVLLRLVEPGRDPVLPEAFLPAAERFKLVARLDAWVLRRTLALIAGLPADTGPDRLGVRLSGLSVCDREFQRQTLELLTAAGEAACRRLCLETSESAVIGHLAEVTAFFAGLRRLDVRVALDDFGATTASFGYLRQLPVDQLKIGQRFVRGLLDDALAEVAVQSFVQVARVLGLTTVAVCVDQPDQLARLRALGIDRARGDLLHPPEPLERLLAGGTAPTVA